MAGAMKKAASHPLGVWGAILATALPYFLDRYVDKPKREKEAVTLERSMWNEVNSTLVTAQEKHLEKIRKLEIDVARLQTALEFVSDRRRPPPRPLGDIGRGGGGQKEEAISLPSFNYIQKKAKGNL